MYSPGCAQHTPVIRLTSHAVILSKISCALPAFSGHITTADKNIIDKFFRKAYRSKLVSQLLDFEILTQTHDKRLFNSIKYPDHCLNFLLPQKRSHSRQLRPKGRDYTLSYIQTTLFKNFFLNRCLFIDIDTLLALVRCSCKVLIVYSSWILQLNASMLYVQSTSSSLIPVVLFMFMFVYVYRYCLCL